MNAAGLFAYGTLKQQEANYLHVAPFVRNIIPDCYVFGELYDMGAYPALVTPGKCRVRGELLISDSLDNCLQAADEIEGDEYERILVDVFQERDRPGGCRLAWAYRFRGEISGFERLRTGEWRGARITGAARS